ncbi:MAG TPA: hypothetical protein ENH82_05315, partial [bacterium]|nr:hypothetical protein [bacterium]
TKDIMPSNFFAQKSPRENIKPKIQTSAHNIIKQKDKQNGVVSFCSWPVLVEGYWILVVLQLRKNAFESHYALKKDKLKHGSRIYTSLIDAVIAEYFNEWEEELRKTNPGKAISLGRESQEIVRAAGKSLMFTPAWSVGNFYELQGLFDACNVISSLKYEGSDTAGKILISKPNHQNVKIILKLSSPIRMTDYRTVRKFLEISSKNICLLSDSADIYGLGQVMGSYDLDQENLFVIEFIKHHTWVLIHANQVMMEVTYGLPKLLRKQINEKKFKEDLPRFFPGIAKDNINKLWLLAFEATKQKHGTMLVVSADAKSEAIRLEKQATRIEPIALTKELMQNVTAIDGAVLIGPDAICYAIGVILDGKASDKGDPGRGARFNSAIRYVEGRNNCLAIVVSEDGSIDLISDSMP